MNFLEKKKIDSSWRNIEFSELLAWVFFWKICVSFLRNVQKKTDQIKYLQVRVRPTTRRLVSSTRFRVWPVRTSTWGRRSKFFKTTRNSSSWCSRPTGKSWQRPESKYRICHKVSKGASMFEMNLFHRELWTTLFKFTHFPLLSFQCFNVLKLEFQIEMDNQLRQAFFSPIFAKLKVI